MKRIRVMIVEDSDVVRKLLEAIIGRDPRLEVAASVHSAEEALQLLHRVAPDVISMDIRLPGMNGFEATQRIMAERPTPVVVISASVESDDLKISMNALRAGALAVLEKPVGLNHDSYHSLAHQICSQLVLMSDVRVVRQRHRKAVPRPAPVLSGDVETSGREPVPCGPFKLLGIVTSTGGPEALTELLRGIPRDFALPVVLVQHIVPAFLAGFASWLGGIYGHQVSIAEAGEIPRPGNIYVAPAEQHLRIGRTGRFTLTDEPPVSYQRPSGTVLFQSMAQNLGPQALAVLLTGMGEDGAAGMLEIREAGGYTIAEDETTAVVNGMPAAARRIGAVCESLPLGEIAPRLIQLAREKQEVAP